MLRVTIRAGHLEHASKWNEISWLDIAYTKLEPIAGYKAVLFVNGVGALGPTPIFDYPRWSGSLWDLVARAIARAIWPDPDDPREEIMPVLAGRAFTEETCALIEHP